MAIDFTCPVCGAEIEADEAVAGSQAQCPQCQGTMMIPLKGMRAGTKLGHFTVIRKLGAGAMGEVWLARQDTMDREVALKILSPAMTHDPDFVRRFMKEVRMAARLEHPNIITAFDAGQHDTIYYLAVAYVDGEDLSQVLKRDGAIPEEDALQVARCVADGLDYAWGHFQILHRDIKPSNIMLTSEGDVRLMDLGISKSMAEEVSLTMTGYIVGTPQYMSPEQARAEENMDFRADVYSLGATLYHLVTGSVPFSGTTMMGILTKHITEPLESPRSRNPNVSEACSALIETMMAKDRDERQQSWDQVIEDIAAVLAGRMPGTPRPEAGRSMVATMTSEDLRKIRTGGKIAVSHDALAAAAQRHRQQVQHSVEAKPSRKPLFIGLGIAALIAVAIGVGFVATRTDTDHAPPSVATEPAPAPAPPVSGEITETPDEHEDVWTYATTYAAEHPEDFEQAIAHFETVKQNAAGSKYELMADAEIRRLEGAQAEARQQAIKAALAALEQKTQPLLDKQDYAGAAELLRSYAGEFAMETAEQREELAKGYAAKGSELADQKQQAAETAREKVDDALAAVAEDLVAGKEAGAHARVEALEGDAAATPDKKRVEQLSALLNGLASIDEAVLESFRADIGKQVEIPGRTQPVRFTITAVKEGAIHGVRQLGAGTAGIQLTPEQIPFAEKYKRLEDRVDPCIRAVCAGVYLCKTGKHADAVKYFAEAGILAEPLATECEALTKGRNEVMAKRELERILRKAAGTGAATDWASVSKQLKGKKFSPTSASALQKDIAAFNETYGKTSFAAKHGETLGGLIDLIDQTTVANVATDSRPSKPTTDDYSLDDKLARRIAEARTRTGKVIEVSPDGEGDSFTIAEAMPQIRSGMVVRFRGGDYAAAGDNGTITIPTVRELVIEGTRGKKVQQLDIRPATCQNLFVRNLCGGSFTPPGGERRATVVDSMFSGAYFSTGDVLMHNCSVGHAVVSGQLTVSSCTWGNVLTRSGCVTRLHAMNSVFADETAVFGIGEGSDTEIRLENCLIMLTKGAHLGGTTDATGTSWEHRLRDGFVGLSAMSRYVKAKDTLVEGFSFADDAVPKWLYTVVPRLAHNSPGKGKGPGGRDLGANLDANGMPYPYPGSPGAPVIKTAEDLHAALKAVNPHYTGKGEFKLQRGEIVSAVLVDCNLRDISPLRGLPLTDLCLDRNAEIGDFSPLRGMALQAISVQGCERFDDAAMSLLTTMPLHNYVYLTGTAVSDLSPLKGKDVAAVNAGRTQIKDIESLRTTVIRHGLVVADTAVLDLSPIRGKQLRQLSINGTGIKDLGPLSGMPLEELRIYATPISDLKLLRKFPLKTFCFTPGNITNPDDIAILRRMKSLQFISNSAAAPIPAEEFWRKFDAGEFK